MRLIYCILFLIMFIPSVVATSGNWSFTDRNVAVPGYYDTPFVYYDTFGSFFDSNNLFYNGQIININHNWKNLSTVSIWVRSYPGSGSTNTLNLDVYVGSYADPLAHYVSGQAFDGHSTAFYDFLQKVSIAFSPENLDPYDVIFIRVGENNTDGYLDFNNSIYISFGGTLIDEYSCGAVNCTLLQTNNVSNPSAWISTDSYYPYNDLDFEITGGYNETYTPTPTPTTTETGTATATGTATGTGTGTATGTAPGGRTGRDIIPGDTTGTNYTHPGNGSGYDMNSSGNNSIVCDALNQSNKACTAAGAIDWVREYIILLFWLSCAFVIYKLVRKET